VAWLPKTLPDKPPIVWEFPVTRAALAGIAATSKHVLVADRGPDEQSDIWRCVDAGTGQQLWQLEHPTVGDLDWGNSPRATPLIRNDLAYLLGAYGDLHCVRLEDGKIVWKRNIVVEFGAGQLKWGMCVSPVIVDGKLIVSPGAKDASLAALDPNTGKTIWKTPGRPAAYATFIAATFGGRRQLVGYDATTLGGWDIATGRRLWELTPENEGDFNVPSPIAVDGKLLVTTENNCTRLYDFADDGTIQPKPLAENWDLYPDTVTPVVVAGKVFCGFGGELFCLDLGGNGKKPLEALWTEVDDAYLDHSSMIGNPKRILVAGSRGELLLVSTRADRYELLARLSVFGEDCDLISHPALVGTRLFIRDSRRLLCLELKEE
jgi:outer membrane protein assembly factor BamB